MASIAVMRRAATTTSRVCAVRCANIVVPSGQVMRFATAASGSKGEIDASKLTITKTTSPKKMLPKEQLVFGHSFSDHMLEVDWDENAGWHTPRIIPFGNLSIHPAASSLHYAMEAFEGMKAYVDSNNKIRMFRPDMNMKRLNVTNARMALPTFNGDQFLECIKELLKVDKHWIPRDFGYSLYIRPTIISTHPFLGVGPTKAAKLFVINSPVGPYYKEGFNPVTLYADSNNVRAWPGGVGFAKCGGNYAPTIYPQQEAAKKGYAQIMWLFGPEKYVTEVGTMNQFFFWQRKDGKKELITPPLDGTILPGVTRDSILALARDWKEFEVSEKPVTIHQVIDAINEGRLIEAFGAGTAAIVSPVKGFHFEGKDYVVPLDKSNPQAKAGKLTQRFADTIMSIQYGRTAHPWSVVVD